jgi:hypothetical protein
MFVNIEGKRKNVPEDPMIQLGAWVAAEFKKRKLEGSIFALITQKGVHV